MLRDMLKLEGIDVGRKHVGTLMKKLSIEALYRKANTSRRNQAHRIYPYRLRKLTIDRPNQVWGWTRPTFRCSAASSISQRPRLGDAPCARLAPVEYADRRPVRRGA
jgi:hypothetical protein